MPNKILRREFLATSAAILASSNSAFAARSVEKSSSKKGCCFVCKPQSQCLEKTEALNAKWLYTWGSDRPEGLPKQIEFSPMIWGNSPEEKLSARIEAMRPLVKSGELQYLMGFNEPDQKSQSNMTVDRVLELWPILMDLGVPLVSPGCVHYLRFWMV